MTARVIGMNVVEFTVPKYAAYRKPANGKQQVRSAVRFPLRMEVRILTDLEEFPAFTKDVSACGVLFEMDKAIPPGSLIQFTLTMPGEALGLENEVRIHCNGRVVRSIGDGARYYTASSIDEYEFV